MNAAMNFPVDIKDTCQREHFERREGDASYLCSGKQDIGAPLGMCGAQEGGLPN